MNLGALRSRLAMRLAIPSGGDARLDVGSLNECINIALTDISQEKDWPWLLASSALTLTSGTASIPTDFARARELVIGGNPALFADVTEFIDSQSDTGVRCWTLQGASIVLTPTPTAATTGTLWYIRNEPTLSTDVASPLLPSVHQQTLIARASYHANYRRTRERELAADLAEYERGLKAMERSLRGRSGASTVRDMSESPHRRRATW